MRAQYDLTMPILYDATGALEATLGMPPNSGELVLSHGNVIASRTQGAHAIVPDRIAEILGY